MSKTGFGFDTRKEFLAIGVTSASEQPVSGDVRKQMGGTEDSGGRPSAGPQDPTWGPHGLKCGWDLGLASDQLKTAKGVGCHFCGNIM